MELPEKRRLTSLILLLVPLAGAYFASYFFRTINALISTELSGDLDLGAGRLGLLTSVYFLTFAFAQVPAGLLLDRFGPRRVQTVLLLIAAFGAYLFATAKNFELLLVGRGLIGLGVAASLVGGLKATALWFPRERLALFNGCFITIGTFGVVAATAPSEFLLQFIGWRTLFASLTIICLVCAGLIFRWVPETLATSDAQKVKSNQLRSICTDPRFWRLAPLSTMCISTAWALQGLWAAPWFTDVEQLDHHSVVSRLFAMAIALSCAALALGVLADRLRSRGVRPQTILVATALLFIGMQIALVFHLPLPSALIWCLIAGTGAATVNSYSILAEYFPKEIAGQANSALNTLHIGGAFLIQAGIGLMVGHWAPHAGHYPAVAYKIAIGVIVLFELAALLWFIVPRRVLAKSHQAASIV